jgi:hypothetical protein
MAKETNERKKRANVLIFKRPPVTTLILSSQPKQRLAKVQAKSEARESHFMLLGV